MDSYRAYFLLNRRVSLPVSPRPEPPHECHFLLPPTKVSPHPEVAWRIRQTHCNAIESGRVTFATTQSEQPQKPTCMSQVFAAYLPPARNADSSCPFSNFFPIMFSSYVMVFTPTPPTMTKATRKGSTSFSFSSSKTRTSRLF